jgi:hypothetical protein
VQWIRARFILARYASTRQTTSAFIFSASRLLVSDDGGKEFPGRSNREKFIRIATRLPIQPGTVPPPKPPKPEDKNSRLNRQFASGCYSGLMAACIKALPAAKIGII